MKEAEKEWQKKRKYEETKEKENGKLRFKDLKDEMSSCVTIA